MIKGGNKAIAWAQAVHGESLRGRSGCAAGEALCAVCLDIEQCAFFDDGTEGASLI